MTWIVIGVIIGVILLAAVVIGLTAVYNHKKASAKNSEKSTEVPLRETKA